jgi:hypothetical protein
MRALFALRNIGGNDSVESIVEKIEFDLEEQVKYFDEMI